MTVATKKPRQSKSNANRKVNHSQRTTMNCFWLLAKPGIMVMLSVFERIALVIAVASLAM